LRITADQTLVRTTATYLFQYVTAAKEQKALSKDRQNKFL